MLFFCLKYYDNVNQIFLQSNRLTGHSMKKGGIDNDKCHYPDI